MRELYLVMAAFAFTIMAYAGVVQGQTKTILMPEGSVWKGQTTINGKKQNATLEVVSREGKKMTLLYELENKSKFRFECEFEAAKPKNFTITSSELLEAVKDVDKEKLTVGGIQGGGSVSGQTAALKFLWKENNLGPYSYSHKGKLVEPDSK